MGKWSRHGGAGMARLRKAMKDAETLSNKVGWLESSVYPDGTPAAYVAAIQEYGDPDSNIPSRSFMRTSSDEHSQRWVQIMTKAVMRIPSGQGDIRQALDLVGLAAEGDIRRKITQIFEPPLAESTIKSRARRAGKKPEQVSTKPLNDTGYMLATLTSVTTGKES